MFTDEQIAKLLNAERIVEDLPFADGDNQSFRDYYQALIRTLEREHGLLSRVEWDDYGSGYASFADAWFYFPDGSARASSLHEHHHGIWVLLSRTSNYFVLGQGQKTWHDKGGGSYLPSFEDLDQVTHPALKPLEEIITDYFTSVGMVRLKSTDLAELLPPNTEVPTILTGPPYRHFDALFHWED
jgi:hypothetical protein